jgi:hypothetical protein
LDCRLLVYQITEDKDWSGLFCLEVLYIQWPKYLQKNIDSNVFKALRALKKDPDRVILSADKGNCVVVMDKHDYREKALSLLNNRNTYSILKSDPTGKTQRGLNAKLLLLKKSNIISKATYEKLYSSDGLSPRFYGLPKIHKPEIPLRPVVSFVNSPTYEFQVFWRKCCPLWWGIPKTL